MRVNTTAASERTLEDLRNRLSTVSSDHDDRARHLTNRFAATSEEMRQQASRAASEIAAEQGRLREQMERLPIAAQESSESMRRALQDQIKALDQLSALTARTAAQRDVTQPMGADVPPNFRSAPAAARRRPARLPRSRPPSRRRWAAGSDRAGAGGRPGPHRRPRRLVARRSAGARIDGTRTVPAHGGARRRPHGIQPRSRGHRTRPRYCDVGRHLDAP